MSRHARAILQEYGGARLDHVRTEHIVADLVNFNGPQRLARRKTWRQLGTFWKENQLISKAPTEGVMAVKTPK